MENVYVLFFQRTNKDQTKKISVRCRITYEGKRTEFATDVKVVNKSWNKHTQKVVGTDELSTSMNRTLVNLRNRINNIIVDLRNRDIAPEGSKILEVLSASDSDRKENTLLNFYRKEIAKKEALQGSEYSKSTVAAAKYSYNILEFFLTAFLGKKDIALCDIDYKFVRSFEEWGRTEGVFKGRKKSIWTRNTFLKELCPIKKIVQEAFSMGIIPANPFGTMSFKKDKPSFKFLTEQDVETISNLVFSEEEKHLEVSRDIFVFCCYTGFAFADVKALTTINLVEDHGFGVCVSRNRTKTKVHAYVPLLDKPKEILDKYHGNDQLFPVPTYYMYSKALTEISKRANIVSDLKSHVARHTAATYFLNNGIPEEITCKALGLSSATILRSTYGKLLNNTVTKHFATLNTL